MHACVLHVNTHLRVCVRACVRACMCANVWKMHCVIDLVFFCRNLCMQWLQCMHMCMYLHIPVPHLCPPFILPTPSFPPPHSSLPIPPTCRPHCMLLTTTSVLGQMLPLHWSSMSQEVGSFTHSVGMKWLWLYVRSFVCMYTYIHCCLIKVCMAHSHMCMHIMYVYWHMDWF